MTKPRIRYLAKPWAFGVQFGPMYICETDIAIGFGKSASEAYEAWLKDVPKTVIGRTFRRLLNWLAS